MASLEGNKIAAAILLAGVVGWTAAFVAELLIHPEELEETAYAIDIGADAVAAVPEEEVLEPVGPLLASADVDAGQGASRACGACHTFDSGGANKLGPALYGIIGNDKGAVPGYSYSAALEEMPGDWTYENMNAWLANPKKYLSGTKMNYAGMRNVGDRANLIAWMRTLDDSPEPLPAE